MTGYDAHITQAIFDADVDEDALDNERRYEAEDAECVADGRTYFGISGYYL